MKKLRKDHTHFFLTHTHTHTLQVFLRDIILVQVNCYFNFFNMNLIKIYYGEICPMTLVNDLHVLRLRNICPQPIILSDQDSI